MPCFGLPRHATFADVPGTHFAFPLHVTSDSGDGDAEGENVLAHVASRDKWVLQIHRLLAAYTKVGVASARIAELVTHELSPRLFQAVLRWELHNAHGDQLYRFSRAIRPPTSPARATNSIPVSSCSISARADGISVRAP